MVGKVGKVGKFWLLEEQHEARATNQRNNSQANCFICWKNKMISLKANTIPATDDASKKLGGH